MNLNLNTPYSKSVGITYGLFTVVGMFLLYYLPLSLEPFGVITCFVGIVGIFSEVFDTIYYFNQPRPGEEQRANWAGTLVYLSAAALGLAILFFSDSLAAVYIGACLSLMSLAACLQTYIHEMLRPH